MKKTRILALLLALSLLLLSCAACGQGGETPAPASDPVAEAPPPTAEPEPEAPAPAEPDPAPAEEAPVESTVEEPVEASPLTGSTVKGLTYPIGDPDNPTEFSLFSVWGMGFDEFLDSWNSLPRLDDIQAATGCRMTFKEVSATGASEQFNLMVASGDLTDIIQAADYYVGGLGAAFDDEVIIDLSDIIEDNAPIYYDLLMNHANQATRDTVLTNGRHLSMNTLKDEAVSDMGLVVRGDWLEELGMEVPETLDQFTDVLYAIYDKYGCSQTLYVNSNGEIQYMDGIFGVNIFKIANSTDISVYVEDGQVKSALLSDEYREFVEYVHQLISDGIINKDFYVNASTESEAWGLVSSGDTGVWRLGADSMHKVAEYVGDDKAVAVPIPKLVKNEGDKYRFGQQVALADNKGYSLTANCAEPEKCLQFFDWFFTDEGVLLSNFGKEGETFTYVDGKPQYTDFILNNPNPNLHMMFAVILNTYNQCPIYNIVSKMWVGYTPEETAAIHLWSDTSNDDTSRALPTAASLSSEETSLIANQMTAVISYGSEEILKFMTGAKELDDANWESFKAGCVQQGIEECLEVYQAAYDGYLSGERTVAETSPGPPPDGGGGAPPEGPPPD